MSISVKSPVCLIILDGFGIDVPGDSNAISLANTPVLDELFAHEPHCLLKASGEAVGLPEGQMGNSEVGHLNIGAGRVVDQELTRINKACRSLSIAEQPVLARAFTELAQSGATLHLMGLLSDGGVHSSQEHLYALMESAYKAGVAQMRIHPFMDGRDVSPTSGVGFLEGLEAACERYCALGCDVRIASVSGRYYAMDRDKRWERIELAYEALGGKATCLSLKPSEYVAQSYDAGTTDEFIVPVSFVGKDNIHSEAPAPDDFFLFFNFRPDRARQLSHALCDEDFAGFERSWRPKDRVLGLTEYDPELSIETVFEKEFPQEVLADVVAEAGLRQFHIAETEKYAHVTFFFNGGKEEPKEQEERCLVASPKVATYDLQPEMSAYKVAEELSCAIRQNKAELYICNFANCDMVGHTGFIPAAQAAVEAVDSCLGQVLNALKEAGGCALITADHGNADKMCDSHGKPFTAHTTALVPLIFVANDAQRLEGFTLKGLVEEQGKAASTESCMAAGALCDIAPTILELMGLDQPDLMSGTSLLEKA